MELKHRLQPNLKHNVNARAARTDVGPHVDAVPNWNAVPHSDVAPHDDMEW